MTVNWKEGDVVRLKSGGPKKIGPFEVPKGMCSGPSAALATAFQIKGVNYSISSACATSAHCIGNATELIQWGKQDVMFAGGCEELDWTLSDLFDAMGAMSTHFNGAWPWVDCVQRSWKVRMPRKAKLVALQTRLLIRISSRAGSW